MRIFAWNGHDQYDRLLVATLSESRILMEKGIDQYHQEDYCIGNDCYFLASEKGRFFSPIPGLDYAFGFREGPRYGEELPADDPDRFLRYRLVPFEQTELLQADRLLGGICGDVAGSRYEYMNIESIDEADLAASPCTYTDETLLIAAVAAGLSQGLDRTGPDWLKSAHKKEELQESVRRYLKFIGSLDPYRGFDDRFFRWLENGRPYASDRGDAACRAAPAGWFAKSLPEALELARLVSEVSHTSKAALAGAQVIAGSIYLLRKGASPEEIRRFAGKYYPGDFKYEKGGLAGTFDPAASVVVPAALAAFLAADSYAGALKKAIELGGDSDSIASLAGSLAETVFPVPEYLRRRTVSTLPAPLARALYTAIRQTEN